MTRMETPDPASGRRRNPVWVAVSVIVLALIGLGAYLVTRPPTDQSGAPTPTPGATVTSVPTAGQEQPEETPAPTRTSPPPLPEPGVTPSRVPSTEAEDFRPELEPVEPDQTVVGEDGLKVALTRIEHVQGEAVQPGEVSGPAIRVTITLTNATQKELNAALIAVNAFQGEDRTPVGKVIKPGALPFEGRIAPGESTYAIYIFVIPPEQRDDVTITVDYLSESAVVVFRGAVG